MLQNVFHSFDMVHKSMDKGTACVAWYEGVIHILF